MTKIVSIISLKGGVAKTTTTVQLAECLSSPPFSKKVLVIDLDPQTNATIALIGEKRWKENDKDGQTLFHLFNDIAVCKKVRTGSKIEKELKVKKWEQLTQKI